MSADTTRRPGLPVVVGVVLALGLLCTVLALRSVIVSEPVEGWQILLLLCLLPLSELALLHVRFGGDAFSFTWGEASLLIGFAMVSPAWLVLLAGPSVALVHLAKGRGVMKSA